MAEIAWSKEDVARIAPLPSLSAPHFSGTPSYLGTPNYGQLRKEVREFAYALSQKHGWDAETCWLRAESALFWGLEEVGYGSSGYRIYVRKGTGPHWGKKGHFEVKVITPEYPVLFKLIEGQSEPARRECVPVTLCSALKKTECPDNM